MALKTFNDIQITWLFWYQIPLHLSEYSYFYVDIRQEYFVSLAETKKKA
jgi:hypothetical protein